MKQNDFSRQEDYMDPTSRWTGKQRLEKNVRMDDLMLDAMLNLINLTHGVIQLNEVQQKEQILSMGFVSCLSQELFGEKYLSQVNFGQVWDIEQYLYRQDKLFEPTLEEVKISRQVGIAAFAQTNNLFIINQNANLGQGNFNRGQILQWQDHYTKLWRKIKTNQYSFKKIHQQLQSKNKSDLEPQQVNNSSDDVFPFQFTSIQQFYTIICSNAESGLIFNAQYLGSGNRNFITLFQYLRNIIREEQHIQSSKLLFIMQAYSDFVSSADSERINQIIGLINGYYIKSKFDVTDSSPNLSFQRQLSSRLSSIDIEFGQSVENQQLNRQQVQSLIQAEQETPRRQSPSFSGQSQIDHQNSSSDSSDRNKSLKNLVSDIDSQNLNCNFANVGGDRLQQLMQELSGYGWNLLISQLNERLSYLQSSKLFQVSSIHPEHKLNQFA